MGTALPGNPNDTRDEDGRTPLMVAAEAGSVAELRELIAAGADPDAAAHPPGPDPKTPPTGPIVPVVTRRGLFELVWRIVGGQDPVRARRKTNHGPTALMIASAAGQSEPVAALLAAGASPNVRDRDGFTALSYAAALGHAAIARALIAAGAEVDPIDHYDMTPIILAALTGEAEAVQVLAEAGASLGATKPGALGPLALAAYYGHPRAVRVLLAAGAGADRDAKGLDSSPLALALDKGHTEVVQALTESGTDLDAVDMFKLTPLMKAVATRNAASLRVLLAAGADANRKVGGNEPLPTSVAGLPAQATALHLAAALGDPEIVATLLAAGADPTVRDGLGFTPLWLATASGHAEVVRLLVVAAPPPENDLPTLRGFELVAAVRHGDRKRVRALLDAGTSADVKIPDTFRYHYLLRCEATDDFVFDASEARGQGSFEDAGRPVLRLAVEQGQDGIVADLIAAGATVDGTSKNVSRTAVAPLFDAAKHGRRAAVMALIAAGADVNARDVDGSTPLFHAVLAGDAEIVRDLIAAGADVDLPDREKTTPLSHASYGGNLEILEMLLRAGARVGSGDLGNAAFSGSVEATRVLLEACRAQKVTPEPGILSTAVMGRSVPVVKLLLDAGFDPNAGGERDMPLIMAQIDAYRGSDDLVRLLLEAGADVEARDHDGNSALAHAVICSSARVVRLLLERGADTESRMRGDHEGQTPLIHAAGQGLAAQVGPWLKGPDRVAEIETAGEETVRLLLDFGADVEARDLEAGRTALMHAAGSGRERMVRILIDAGADLAARDTLNGRTALMWAATEGHAGAARLLLDAGADPYAEDLDGHNAAELAARRGNRAVESLLPFSGGDPPRARGSASQALRRAAEEGDAETIRAAARAGAEINARLSGGLTALVVAVKKGHRETIAALLDAGANPNVRDPECNTPLITAIRARRPEIVDRLLQAGADPSAPGRAISGCGRETPLSVVIGERCLIMGNAWQDVVNGFRDEYQLGADEHLAIVRALIAAGVAVDATDELGMRPLWYAFDMGQDELADLLVEAGAGGDPVSAAYLRARELPTLAQADSFQETVRSVAALCDAEPEPLSSPPGHREFLSLRRGGPFPPGPTIGAAFTVPRERVDELIATHQERLHGRGASLFRARRYAGRSDLSRQRLGLLPTSNLYDVIAAICAAGSNWGWVSPALYIRDLLAIEPVYPFRLIGCESGTIELEFATPIGDVAALARRLSVIRTSLGALGLPEQYDVEDVATALRQRPQIGLYWL